MKEAFLIATIVCALTCSADKVNSRVKRDFIQAHSPGSVNIHCGTFGCFDNSPTLDPFHIYHGYRPYYSGVPYVNGKKKRDAEADPNFIQNYQPGSFSVNQDCLSPGSCAGDRFSNGGVSNYYQNYGAGSSAVNYDYGSGSSGGYGGGYGNSYGGGFGGYNNRGGYNSGFGGYNSYGGGFGRKRREAQGDFVQNYQPGSSSVNQDCTAPGSCAGDSFSNGGVSNYNQQYGPGSSALNIDNSAGNGGGFSGYSNGFGSYNNGFGSYNNGFGGGYGGGYGGVYGRKRRSAQGDFVQNYQPGSSSVNQDCVTPGSCSGDRFSNGGISNYNQLYGAGSSSVNIDYNGGGGFGGYSNGFGGYNNGFGSYNNGFGGGYGGGYGGVYGRK